MHARIRERRKKFISYVHERREYYTSNSLIAKLERHSSRNSKNPMLGVKAGGCKNFEIYFSASYRRYLELI